MAEHSAVNRVVVGSSPTWGALSVPNSVGSERCFFVLREMLLEGNSKMVYTDSRWTNPKTSRTVVLNARCETESNAFR